jgi:PBP1b-binding outer membrane lipoprotein LpoB
MIRKLLIISSLFISVLITGCSKKSHPTTSANTETKPTTTATTTTPKPKEPIPTVISVNDKVASKSVDGRLYYDLEGHRYWRSKKDGRYYLFNKSMYNDPAFKP